jgi:tRNA pseudouridine55 synthase
MMNVVLPMACPVLNGLLVLDKPAGMTSRAAVDRIVACLPRSTRIGHTGTLDPLATGVLVICIGSATRFAEYVQDMAKTYRTTLVLGARSDTDDGEGTITPVAVETPPDRARVAHVLQDFVGDIEQVPPNYSAAKVGGRRAYDLARQGREVTLQSRRVHIAAIDILDFTYPRLSLEIHCGKGTYIRSLARDLGQRLGCGAYVETLRRTQIGPFSAANAVSLDADAAKVRGHIQPVAAAVSDLPRVTLKPEKVAAARHGRALPLFEVAMPKQIDGQDNHVALLDASGELVAVARIDPARSMLLPTKVLSGAGKEAT